MAQPVVDPNWASDTNFSSGPESGSATKVSPGAGPLAQGFVPGLSFVGPYANYTLYWLCQWAAYLKGLNTDAVFLAFTFVWTALHRFTAGIRASAIQLVTGGDLTYTDSAGTAAPRAREMRVALTPTPVNISGGAVLVQWYAVSGVLSNSSISAGDCAVFSQLPRGIVITAVDFVVSGVGGQTVTCQFWKNTTQLGSDQVSSGGTVQTLALTGLSETVAVAQNYWFKFTATAAGFQIQEVVVKYNDPGFGGN